MEEQKKTVYSAIQPTAILTLGNYIGAIDNWLKLQSDYNSIFAIADLHALTVRQVPAELRQRSLSLYALLMACGLDPSKTTMYFQSHVPQHAELAWILNCYTYVGEMNRMTQFKDKSAKNADNINMGLMDYPVLMAADILLYQADFVPIGEDQRQHLEIARDIAIRFNGLYSPTFTVPEGYFGKQGAKIYSLQDPLAKMSKSDPDVNATVSVVDEPDAIMRKFKRAVTDSEPHVEFKEGKDGINNLLTIMSVCTGRTVDNIVKEYYDGGYAKFKEAVGEAVVAKLAPIQTEYKRIITDKDLLTKLAREGAEKAQSVAYKTLRKVQKKVGLVER